MWVCPDASAQADDASLYDSAYIESYNGLVMPRFLVTRKSSGMSYSNLRGGYSLRYQPNTTFSVGLGFTYRFATLNLSAGVLKPQESRGSTRNLDAQFHTYGRRFVGDFLIQFYKGFHLPDRRFGNSTREFYVRPDLAVGALGGSVQYVLNNRKFSYRAAFQQTEWQKKSAGTFLVGVELFMGRFRADSTIVPQELQSLEVDGMRKMRFLEFGPNAGYAYTWVFKKFFINTGATIGLNAGLNRYDDGSEKETFAGVSPNTSLRLSSGYNVRQWGVNVFYQSRALRLPQFHNRVVAINAGTLRVNFIYRLQPSNKMKKLLRPIEKVEEHILEKVEEYLPQN